MNVNIFMDTNLNINRNVNKYIYEYNYTQLAIRKAWCPQTKCTCV